MNLKPKTRCPDCKMLYWKKHKCSHSPKADKVLGKSKAPIQREDSKLPLKTLRDLDKFKGYGLFSKGVSEDDLRQEAIKWVKTARVEFKELNLDKMQTLLAIKWIKHFFNLTEEDLKGDGK